ncbi:uncharacterized protein LOC100371968 [Saccoglossus kowalevskii]|uniref:Uncharacterized protein LOC100371968 n=1 Tax=Saccoglossus kowalevskii TaxID=10224 RepID=A0ABM0GNZ8_SACKO|nr:PREDICTED: uncharacterized protein LOC100371968 [Saccoglossus kowalevskii]
MVILDTYIATTMAITTMYRHVVAYSWFLVKHIWDIISDRWSITARRIDGVEAMPTNNLTGDAAIPESTRAKLPSLNSVSCQQFEQLGSNDHSVIGTLSVGTTPLVAGDDELSTERRLSDIDATISESQCSISSYETVPEDIIYAASSTDLLNDIDLHGHSDTGIVRSSVRFSDCTTGPPDRETENCHASEGATVNHLVSNDRSNTHLKDEINDFAEHTDSASERKKKKKGKFRMVKIKLRSEKTIFIRELNTDFVDPYYKLPETELPKKKLTQVHVTHYKSLTEVCIRLIQKIFTGEYRSLQVMLNSLYEKGQSERYRPDSTPVVGGLYTACDDVTHTWHRVKVLELSNTSKSPSVLCWFVDIGWEKRMPIGCLRWLLNRKRLLIPAQSILCSLHRSDKLRKLSTVEKMLFTEKFQHRATRDALWCKVKKRPRNQAPIIKLGASKYDNIVKDTIKSVKRLPKCHGCKQLFTVTSMLLERSNDLSQMATCLQDNIERVNSEVSLVRTNAVDLEQGMALYRETLQTDMQMRFSYMARGLQMALSEYLHPDRPIRWPSVMTEQLAVRSSTDQLSNFPDDEIPQTWV